MVHSYINEKILGISFSYQNPNVPETLKLYELFTHHINVLLLDCYTIFSIIETLADHNKT